MAITPHALHAQRERLTVRAEQLGATTITAPSGTRPTSIEHAQQSLQLALTHRVITQQGSTVFLLGGQWRAVQADLPLSAATASTATSSSIQTLHVVAADLMMLRTSGDRHTVVGVLRPGVYGTSVRLEGAAFVDRIVSPRTTIGVGLSYASSFGKLLPIPVVHVVARPSRRILVDALLPARGDIWWMPRKGLDLGFNASLAGAQYGLRDAQQVSGANTLWLANATVGPQLRWAPRGGKWQLTADGGMTVVRRLEYARDGQSVADLDPANVPYARFALQRLF